MAGQQQNQTYMHNPLIRAALAKTTQDGSYEYDVGRAMLPILLSYFSIAQNFAIIPEFLVPEGSKPDFCIEKFNPDTQEFTPKIFVELKRRTGDSIKTACNQITDSLPQTIESKGMQHDCYIIVVKGKKIAFFEYHNDRSNLDEDGHIHYRGLIPFNHPQTSFVILGRPSYIGQGNFTSCDSDNEDEKKTGWGYTLELDSDCSTVKDVLSWMSGHAPTFYPGPV